ncbi:type II secretion system F family protein [uncultured Ilyobacter sp.]|uniref:type II secretion system F family protein n=1 Tax=uncultured Ilyobacter sp. TaxID=544433 RepID=UPI0029F48A17|nr:type II secretion system F family protein [uncultured Ilyobacter sp.]
MTGTLVADTPAAAARMLDERTLLPVEVAEVKTSEKSFLTGGARKISGAKVSVFYEQLADLLRAGVPVLRALKVLSEQAAAPALSRVLREVHDDVAGGDTLADAMDHHPHAFSPLHVSMIRAGEKGGFLEEVLARVSDFIRRQDDLKSKFVGAMIYPCILATVGLGAIIFVMSFVVPRIRDLLSEQDLPLPTKIVFALSDILSLHYMEVGGVLLVLIIAIVSFFQTQVGKGFWAHMQLRMWGIGPIYTMVALCRFCRIFGTLLANGIQILHALRIAKDSAGNQILSDAIEKAASSVGQGESLTPPLAKSKVFPPAMLDMIAVAEESNTLDRVLVEIADTQEMRTARQLDMFVRLLEPLMLLFMGAMLLFIAIALLVPILQMATTGLR